MQSEQWKELIDRYKLVKKLYIVCEEADPELQTQIQQNKFKSLHDRDFNVGFAVYLILCSIQCTVWSEKKTIFSLESSTVQLMSYAFKNWDLSKEAIILLGESLANSKTKEKHYDISIAGLESFITAE